MWDLWDQVHLTPRRITLLYVVFGFFALFLSDVVFSLYLSDPLLRQVQALKGAVEVVLTAGFIFVLTRRSRDQIEDASKEVRRQRDELQLFYRVFRHNFRNDINIIQGAAALARDDPSETVRKEKCDLITKTTQRMLEYSEKAQRIRKVTEQIDRPKVVNVSELITQVTNNHPDISADVEVVTSVPDSVTVRVNPMLQEAIEELITNSLSHNDASTPSISIELSPDGGPQSMCELKITDNGPGLPGSEIEALNADMETQLLHSTGMGLWFVNWVITHSNGQLSISAPNGGGTEIQIYLPTSTDSPWEHE